jgi:opacity protein-like surface antigen
MNALALALALALGPDDLEDRLPRSLSESYVQAAPAEVTHEVLVGLHVGGVDAHDGKSPSFVVGFEWRIHILPWLGAGGSFDFQTRQKVDNTTGADYFQIPFMWSFMLYPPIDLGPFLPYAQAGVGFTITDVSALANRDNLDVNFLYFVGFGAELKLSSNVFLVGDVRYVWAQEPSGAGSFSADWGQFTIGLLIKMSQ